MFAWDDMRVFLMVARTLSTARAAERLKVNQSTVSRRIAALEEALGMALFERGPRGIQLKSAAERLMGLAEEMEATAFAVEREISGRSNQPEGKVRVTTIEDLASVLIAPELPAFRRRWPNIDLVLLTTPVTLDLSRGEADVSLRLARPTQSDLHARKVGGFGYGVFASDDYIASVEPDRLAQMPALDWIVLEDVTHPVPESRWLREKLPGMKPVLSCNGIKTQIAAVQAGLGVAVVPRPYAYFHPGLRRLPIDTQGLYRELWLVVHSALRHSAPVQAVMDFLLVVVRKPIKPGKGTARPD